mmetsp:Transcript_24508/g.38012  ORF Transcript_24508/g.38012 Transcript_24508/m.38012 type:complete len:111 (-) Transcript_24508:55-387(-)
MRNYAIAIIVIDGEVCPKWAADNGKDAATLHTDPEFKAIVYEDMMRLADANNLNSLEKPKQIRLITTPFSPVGNEILTPTMKLKRNVARKVFEKEIKEMYEEEPIGGKKD